VTDEVGAMDATLIIAETRYDGVDDFVEWNEVTVPEWIQPREVFIVKFPHKDTNCSLGLACPDIVYEAK